MFNYFIEVFCKDTVIGLSSIEKNKVRRIYKSKYSNTLFSPDYQKSAFNCFTIDQTPYLL